MATIEERQISNVIANATLEGLKFSDQQIVRLRAMAYGEMTIDEAIAEIHAEIAERNKIPEPA
ncbi:MAG: antitoxin VbhA family protein [Gammaproteobacteria bacterium]|nr:antitoxin VbhA family protein [Gammaproteobacteria bacterium]MBL4729703.1 antitoxin VbhA family protein [Gammaproteobacteria bacterium]